MSVKEDIMIFGVSEKDADTIINNTDNLFKLSYWLTHENCVNVIQEFIKKGYLYENN